ncbi:unnamed protein product, partial [Acidocella sp. C78]
VDEPSGRPRAAVQPGAKHPETLPRLILDRVIVAQHLHLGAAGCLRGFVTPPFACDPLRPGGAGDAMAGSAPSHQQRRIVGHRRDHLDPLGADEQPDRPWMAGGWPAWRRFRYRNPAHRALRHMARHWRQPRQPGPGGQKVEGLGVFRPKSAAQLRLSRWQCCHLSLDLQAFHAESRIDPVQTLGQQAADMRRIARGGCEADRLPDHARIDPPEPDLQNRQAAFGRLQPVAEADDKPGQRRPQLFGRQQWLVMRFRLAPCGRRRQEMQRLGDPSVQAVESEQQVFAETGPDLAAREARQRADPSDSKPVQPPRNRCFQPKSCHRQSVESGVRRYAVPGQRPRRHRGAADRDPGAGQHGSDPRAQPGLAAKQMGAAGDVEQETIRRVRRHQRREALAAQGELIEGALSWRV